MRRVPDASANMSSFFTTPASQKKRKRPEPTQSRPQDRSNKIRRRNDDESISGSEISEQDDFAGLDGSEDGSEDEDEREDAAERRIRLAEQYLANTRQEAMDEAGFDALDIDKENLRRRTGERLKEDTAEGRGKMYRMFAEELEWQSARHSQIRTDTKSVTGVAIAAGYIYTASKDMTIVKWKLPLSGKEVKQYSSKNAKKVGYSKGNKTASEHHRKAILCIAASADGRFVATGGADSRLIIWDAETLKPLKIYTGHRQDNGHRDSVISLAFRRGTNQLFSASKDRTVKIWSCNELAYVETLFGHQDEVLDVDALGKEVCISVGGRDRTARYWRVVEETQLVFRGGGTGSSKKNHEAMSNGDEQPLIQEHEGSIERIAFVDDDTFVTGSNNGMLSLWNIHKKKSIFTVPVAHGRSPPPAVEDRSVEMDPAFQYQDTEMLLHLQPQPRWITALTVLPFSDVVISGSWDGSLRAFQITPDRRRIEPLGVVGTADALTAGIVNDLAIAEKGDRGRDGLYVAAAVGREHRLGRWSTYEGKNCGILFDVPRKAKSALPTITTAEGIEE